MIVYFSIFFLLFILSITEKQKSYGFEYNGISRITVGKCFIFLLLTITIGGRSEIGSDWFSYLYYLERADVSTFFQVLTYKDPGYQIINYFMASVGAGIYGVNLLCGAIFSFGLIYFCSFLPRPYLAVLCAFPYLAIVIAMGYTRQSVSIGIVLLALTSGSLIRFSLFVLIAALFHKSAILMIPFALAITSTNKILTLLYVLVIGVAGYYFLVHDEIDSLVYIYIEKEYQSSGAFIRLFMCLIPSLLYLWFGRFFVLDEYIYKLWRLISIASIFCFFSVVLLPSYSTAIDRIGLYFLPIQLLLFSFLPSLGKDNDSSLGITILISTYYALVLFVWLNFSDHASSWIPYKFFLIEWL